MLKLLNKNLFLILFVALCCGCNWPIKNGNDHWLMKKNKNHEGELNVALLKHHFNISKTLKTDLVQFCYDNPKIRALDAINNEITFQNNSQTKINTINPVHLDVMEKLLKMKAREISCDYNFALEAPELIAVTFNYVALGLSVSGRYVSIVKYEVDSIEEQQRLKQKFLNEGIIALNEVNWFIFDSRKIDKTLQEQRSHNKSISD